MSREELKPSEWAPERIYLQREQGEGGSHTWCEDSVGDGDLIEEAEYVRVGAQDVARAPLTEEQRIAIQECIDYLTPAAKEFSDLGITGMVDSKHARCIRTLRSLLVAKAELSSAVPVGWQIVPSVATEEMADAGNKAMLRHWANGIYEAMLTAAPAAPAVEPTAQALPFAILPDEMEALRRFHECVTDGEGYDVPKDMMKRLSKIGLLRRVTSNLYEHTNFGLSVLNGDFDASPAQAEQQADYCTQHCKTMCQNSAHGMCDGPPAQGGIPEDEAERREREEYARSLDEQQGDSCPHGVDDGACKQCYVEQQGESNLARAVRLARGSSEPPTRPLLFSQAQQQGDGGATAEDQAVYQAIADNYAKDLQPSAREAVAQVDEDDDGLFIEMLYGDDGSPLRKGDKLYRHPAAEQPSARVELSDEQVIRSGYMHTVETDEPLFTFDRQELLAFAREIIAASAAQTGESK